MANTELDAVGEEDSIASTPIQSPSQVPVWLHFFKIKFKYLIIENN